MGPAGGRPDFEDFYAAAAARIVRHAFALTADLAEAEDIAQEAFARAWQRWPLVSRCDSPEAWVRRVATNLAVSRWRRLRVARSAAANLTGEQLTPAIGPDTVALVAGLRALPERQRTVLVLHCLADCSVDQIAAELGCPAGSVKAWLSRGRAALAAAIGADDRDLPMRDNRGGRGHGPAPAGLRRLTSLAHRALERSPIMTEDRLRNMFGQYAQADVAVPPAELVVARGRQRRR
jgi:RNA polymerase sigma-70 factor (ECF subfamily)